MPNDVVEQCSDYKKSKHNFKRKIQKRSAICFWAATWKISVSILSWVFSNPIKLRNALWMSDGPIYPWHNQISFPKPNTSIQKPACEKDSSSISRSILSISRVYSKTKDDKNFWLLVKVPQNPQRV